MVEVKMDYKHCLKELTEASDLLGLLERMMDGCSRLDGSDQEHPWEGMRVALSESRRRIARASEAVIRGLYAEELAPAESRPMAANGQTGRLSAPRPGLAARIQRVELPDEEDPRAPEM